LVTPDSASSENETVDMTLKIVEIRLSLVDAFGQHFNHIVKLASTNPTIPQMPHHIFTPP